MHAMRNDVADEAPAAIRLWDEPAYPSDSGFVDGLTVPQQASELAAHYDLTISRPRAVMEAFRAFDRWLAEAAVERGVSCCLITDSVVHESIERLRSGRLQVGFHLDYFALWHLANDPYAQLAHAVRDSGGMTINPPSKARLFTNKASAHQILQREGLGVPATAILAPGQAIDDSVLAACGIVLEGTTTNFVKPANGFGSSGVMRLERCTREMVHEAVSVVRQHHPHDAILVQQGVSSPRLRADDGCERWAYWRIVYCMGEIIPFWWWKAEAEQGRPSYQRMTGAEIKRLGLQGVLSYCRELAELSRLNWFSTELCACESGSPSRFRIPGPDGKPLSLVAIDYVNDQCDVDVQSRWLGGPPDPFVQHVATVFAEAARARQHCLRLPVQPLMRRRTA